MNGPCFKIMITKEDIFSGERGGERLVADINMIIYGFIKILENSRGIVEDGNEWAQEEEACDQDLLRKNLLSTW